MPLLADSFIGQDRGGFDIFFFVDHQADRQDRAEPNVIHSLVEQHGAKSLRLKQQSRKVGFDLGLEPGELDQSHYQGTTSPAAISCGRGARPRIALRCGKRPNRSMMSWCFLAKPSK